MGRRKNITPVYKHHTSTGLARCWLNGKWVSLGKYGSPESLKEFARVCTEHAAGSVPRTKGSQSVGAGLTLDQLCLRFLEHAALHYRRADGKPTSEAREFKYCLRYVHELYGLTPAAEFGPLALDAVRHKMIEAGWCRGLINRRVDRVRRVFKWASGKQLIPATVHLALRDLTGLQRGRTKAKEAKPVKPVPLEHVQATLPHLNAHVRTMVQLQLFTGMRPGEACSFTMDQVTQEQDMWLYKPQQHKTLHHGKERVIPIGPQARAVLVEFMGSHDWSASLPLFNPRAAELERHAARTAARKRRWRSQPRVKNRKVQAPLTHYNTTVFAANVRRAAKAAGVATWSPNRIRHLYATLVRKQFGLEAAQVLLGHSHANTTQIYAERDESLAVKVARVVG